MEPRSSLGPAQAGSGPVPSAARSGSRDPQARVGGDPLEPEPAVPELIVADRRWHALVPGSGRVVARAARLGGGAGSVLLTTDSAVRRLNARHRGQNHATNVLTFETAPGMAGGNIVLAFGVVRREARAAGRHAAHHLAHLVLHGALHLRGHDHHGAGEARRMELREAWLLHRMGVPNPWRVAGAAAESTGMEARRGGAAPRRGGAWEAMHRVRGAGLQGTGDVLSGRTKPGCFVLRGETNRGAGRGRVLPGVTR